MSVTIQPILYPLSDPPTQSKSPQFRDKDVMQDRVLYNGKSNTSTPFLEHLLCLLILFLLGITGLEPELDVCDFIERLEH